MRTSLSLCAVLLALSAVTLSEAQAQDRAARVDPRALFQQLDKNRDGVVEKSEIPEKGVEPFEKILKHCDDNDDGKLQSSEMRGMFLRSVRAMGGDVPQADPEAIRKMDKNNDGDVTRAEFTGAAPLFGLIDGNRDGKLSKAEIQEMTEGKPFKNLPADSPYMPKDEPNPTAALPERLKAMDRDKDGKISRTEFPGQQAGFDRFDRNKDGFVTPNELPNLENMPNNPGGGAEALREIGQRMRQMDKNNDRKVSRDEFQGPPNLFDRLDVNKDGFITPEDRENANNNDSPKKKAADRVRPALKKANSPQDEKPEKP